MERAETAQGLKPEPWTRPDPPPAPTGRTTDEQVESLDRSTGELKRAADELSRRAVAVEQAPELGEPEPGPVPRPITTTEPGPLGPGGAPGAKELIDLQGGALRSGRSDGELLPTVQAVNSVLDKWFRNAGLAETLPDLTVTDADGHRRLIPLGILRAAAEGDATALLRFVQQLQKEGAMNKDIEIRADRVWAAKDWKGQDGTP